MKLFKKLWLILLIGLSVFIVACDDNVIFEGDEEENVTRNPISIDVLSVNDTHGYLESSSSNSISKIAYYMDKYPNAIKISAGDMFQGTGLSNLTQGQAMIEVMNAMKFDCMVIGNHEFDWGIETILTYFDGDKSNGEADFPLLAANVVNSKGESLKYSKPYIIKEIEDYKIGIIGVIGETLETSISVSSLGGYEFLPTKNIVKQYTKELKDLGCDGIILATHCGVDSNSLYEGIDVDLIINGHTHQNEINKNSNIPSIQSACYAKCVGHTTLFITDSVNITKMKNVDLDSINGTSSSVDLIVKKYIDSLEELLNSPIGTIKNYSKDNLVKYSTALIREYFEVDIAFVNSGAFRTNWSYNKVVTLNDMITMIPFDDEIKIATLKGKQIKRLIYLMNNNYDIRTDTPYSFENNVYYINGKKVEENDTYLIAAVDYIFDKTNYPFIEGTDIKFTTTYLRDILVADFKVKENIDLAKY